MSSTNLYIEADTSSVLLQYKDESGNWVEMFYYHHIWIQKDIFTINYHIQ